MNQHQPNNPLHGLTLEKILVRLHRHYGWKGLDERIQINCFYNVWFDVSFFQFGDWFRCVEKEMQHSKLFKIAENCVTTME